MKRLIRKVSMILLGLLIVSGIGIYINQKYTVTSVFVEGNVHYTDKEIINMVMEGKFGYSSIFLALKYRNKGVDDVAFVEKMDVSIISPDTIKITVYEKALAGYVVYLGQYMYFDKDGIVVESSSEKTDGIPQVTGLEFDHVILHEVLPVADTEIFDNILDITQMMNKYDVPSDEIYFDVDGKITLYYDSIRVAIGTDDSLNEKLMELQYVLPELEGKSGILQMEDFSSDSDMITFDQDQ